MEHIDSRFGMTNQSAYQKRFGDPSVDNKYPTNDFIERLLGRFTVRGFTNQPLEEGQLELLVAAAQSAPTSGMLQTWSVIALTDDESRSKLINTQKTMNAMGDVDSYNIIALKKCSVFLLWLADLHRVDSILKSHAVERDIDTDLLLQTSRAEYHLKAIIDATIAAQTFCLAAESQGLGVMYCGAIRQIPAQHFVDNFNLPPLTYPIFGMAVGHPTNFLKSVNPIRPRLPTDIVLHHNSYSRFDDMSKLDHYNDIHKRCNGSPALYNKDFVDRLKERMSVAETKKEVSKNLNQMGFDFK